jgi:hypothetical protein
MRTQGATFVAAALVLIGAAPASAVTGGFGLAKAVHAGPLPILSAPDTRSGKLTSCHASGPQSRRAGKSSTLIDKIGKKAAPVACEQPPRSQFLSPDALRHATAAALAVLG